MVRESLYFIDSMELKACGFAPLTKEMLELRPTDMIRILETLYYFCRPGGDNDDLVSTRRGRGSGNEVGAAVDIDCSAGDPSGEGRREIGAGISDVHNVDELPERRLLSRFSEQQLEVL